jgi:hypothetical protein
MVVVHIQASTNMVHLGSDLKDKKTFFFFVDANKLNYIIEGHREIGRHLLPKSITPSYIWSENNNGTHSSFVPLSGLSM